MIATKTRLMLSSSPMVMIMTPAERAKGRFMRSPDGHAEGGASPAPAPAPTPDPTPAEPAEPAEVTAESLDAEFAPNPEGASPETDEKPETPEAPKPEEKPEGASVEERIGELTAARREAERQASEARREADDLRARYEPTPKPEGEGQPSGEDQAPDPSKYEFGEADPKFIADLSRYHAGREYEEREAQARTRAEITDMEAKWHGEIAKPEVMEKYPDFDAKVTQGAETGAWDCSPLMAIGIKQSPVGPDVAYHLATTPADASRIAKLPPLQQAVEFGRLEGRFMHAPKPAAPAPVPTTQAPPPPEGRARGAGGKFSVASDTDDFAAFDKMADGLLTK